MRRIAAIVSGLAACTILGGLMACAGPDPRTATKTLSGNVSRQIGTARSRPPSRLLYGVTVNDVTNTKSIVAGLPSSAPGSIHEVSVMRAPAVWQGISDECELTPGAPVT